MNLHQQLAASVAAQAECSLVHDRFGVTISGTRADVLRAMAALETSARHDPRPVPLVRLGQGEYTRDYHSPGVTKDRANGTDR